MKNFLVFTDYSSMEITEKEREMITDAIKTNKNYVVLGGNIYNTYKFGEVVDEKAFYERYPKKRPAGSNYSLNEEEMKLLSGEIEKRAACPLAAEKMLEGLQSYVDSQPTKGYAAKLLDQIKEKIAIKKELKTKEPKRGKIQSIGEYMVNKFI